MFFLRPDISSSESQERLFVSIVIIDGPQKRIHVWSLLSQAKYWHFCIVSLYIFGYLLISLLMYLFIFLLPILFLFVCKDSFFGQHFLDIFLAMSTSDLADKECLKSLPFTCVLYVVDCVCECVEMCAHVFAYISAHVRGCVCVCVCYWNTVSICTCEC